MTDYTKGYSSTTLPYPHQVDLPSEANTGDRLDAITQWVTLVEKANSPLLLLAWREAQRKAALAHAEELRTALEHAEDVIRRVYQSSSEPRIIQYARTYLDGYGRTKGE